MAAQKVRVVSLLPSATEIINVVLDEAKLQAGGQPINVEMVGRSHECDWPPEFSSLPALTASKIKFTTSADVDRQVREQLAAGNGLYSVDKDMLANLNPSVIVTQSLCKVCSVDYCLVEDIATGLDPRPDLVDTNPTCLEEVLRDIRRFAKAVGLEEAGEAAVVKLQKRIAAAVAAATAAAARKKDIDPHAKPETVGFCEWTDPIFCGGHWTPEIIEMAGAKHPINPCKNGGGAGASFTVSGEQFAASDPDFIIIACCGFDIATTIREMAPLVGQPWWPGLRAVKEERVWIVDGNQMFNRPGPRLVDALEWLVSILHDMPEICPPDFPVVKWEEQQASK